MRKYIFSLAMIAASVTAFAQQQASPFVGRWDFNIPTPSGGNSASWIGVSDDHGATETLVPAHRRQCCRS